jgi:hypothetical protein
VSPSPSTASTVTVVLCPTGTGERETVMPRTDGDVLKETVTLAEPAVPPSVEMTLTETLTRAEAPRESVTVSVRTKLPEVWGAVHVVVAVPVEAKVPPVALQVYVKVSLTSGSRAVARRVMLPPGSTVLAEATSESMQGTVLSKGGVVSRDWRVMATTAVSPAAMVTLVACPR